MPEIHVQTGVGQMTFTKVKLTPVPPLVWTAVTVVGVGTALVRLMDPNGSNGQPLQLWLYIAKDGQERVATSQRDAVMEALGLTELPEWEDQREQRKR